MQKIIFENDIKVFGKEVATFPAGVGDAFMELINKTGDKAGERNYYGISYMSASGKMIYKAVAEEKFQDEAKQYDYEITKIEKGEYLSEKIEQWQQKTDCIKDVFTEMMNDDRIDKRTPALEWYKNNDEMFCMIKIISN